jgi:hypothetical protein
MIIRNTPNIQWSWPTQFLQEDAYIQYGRSQHWRSKSDQRVSVDRLALREVVERLQKYHDTYGDLPDGL